MPTVDKAILMMTDIVPGTTYLEFTEAVIKGINTEQGDKRYELANEFICTLMDSDDGTKFPVIYEACTLVALSVPQECLEPARLKDFDRFYKKYRTKIIAKKMLNV